MSRDEIDEIKDKLKELEDRIVNLETQNSGSPKKNMLPIREFFKSQYPVGDVQKTLVICYFLEKYEFMECFTTNDVKEGFRKAREKVPGNLSDKIYKNVKKGYLMDCKEKKDNQKAYLLTGTGIDYFEENNI